MEIPCVGAAISEKIWTFIETITSFVGFYANIVSGILVYYYVVVVYFPVKCLLRQYCKKSNWMPAVSLQKPL